jgi:hypothetical protein
VQQAIGVLGSSPDLVGTLNGQEIGSDLLDLPVGWIAAAAGVLGLIALARPSRARSRGCGTLPARGEEGVADVPVRGGGDEHGRVGGLAVLEREQVAEAAQRCDGSQR